MSTSAPESIFTMATKMPLRASARITGRVTGLRGPIILAKIPTPAYAEVYQIMRQGMAPLKAQVIAFSEDEVTLAPLDMPWGVGPGLLVEKVSDNLQLHLPYPYLGKILDPLGKPLTLESLGAGVTLPLQAPPPEPLSRKPIRTTFVSGVKSIDGFCTVGYGQRLGIFAGPGSGKSTLLGMIARHADVDATVIALVGERGREVNEFISESLGAEGLARAVVVVATSDESPLRRSLAPLTATAIAEHLRSQGKRVLLLIDSLTRTARALREVSLAAGELPVRQGYTNSVYTELPRLIERAGTDAKGSITAFYTVLTDENEVNDALGDELRSLLDGHLVLSNQIAQEGIRPAIDLTRSISRLMPNVCSAEEYSASRTLLMAIAKLKREKDLILLGGTPDKILKAALSIEDELKALLNQRPHENCSIIELQKKSRELAAKFIALQK